MFSKFFKKYKTKVKGKKITIGEIDKEGFCNVYVDGKESKLRMLVFTKEQSEKLLEAVEEAYKKI